MSESEIDVIDNVQKIEEQQKEIQKIVSWGL